MNIRERIFRNLEFSALQEILICCCESNSSFDTMPATTRKRKREEDTSLPPAASKSVGKPVARGKKKSVIVSPMNKKSGKFGKQKLKLTSPVRKQTVRKSRRTVDTDVDETLSETDLFEVNNESDLTTEVEAAPSSASERCEELERELRLLKLEDELAKLRSSKSGSVSESGEKEAVPVPVLVEPENVIDSRFRLPMPAGFNNFGTFNGKSDLETFLSRFENCFGVFRLE